MTTADTGPDEWNALQRGAFRFLFVYLVLTFFPLAQTQPLLYPEGLRTAMTHAWDVPVGWISIHVLHLRVVPMAGIDWRDAPFYYIRLACIIVLASLIAVVWSLLDHRRHYRVLYSWTRVWLRYVLAFVLFDYGLDKVIKLQFPDLRVGDLAVTYGASSPQQLLYNFMGFSTPYTFFGGAGEVLAAGLLFFRRTATLGALVAAAVLSNVVMLNYSYYFGVLLFSLQLFLVACVLVTPDLRRLADLLVFNRPTQPVPLGPGPSTVWMRRGALALKVVAIGIVVGDAFYDARDQYLAEQPPAPPRGTYAVTSFQEGGKEVWTRGRWTTFSLGKLGNVWMHAMDDSTRFFTVSGDPLKVPSFTIVRRGAPGNAAAGTPPDGNLRLTILDGGLARVDGTFEGNPMTASLRLLPVSDFPLMRGRSHWLREDFFR